MKKALYENTKKAVVEYYNYLQNENYDDNTKDILYTRLCNSLSKLFSIKNCTENEQLQSCNILENMAKEITNRYNYNEYINNRDFQNIFELLLITYDYI